MNKFKLRLKGFIGIKRGLGLDEITIDFGSIRPDRFRRHERRGEIDRA